jgi:hypothetical protein
MDYQKLSEDFDEASKATTENIMDILHDIVRVASEVCYVSFDAEIATELV